MQYYYELLILLMYMTKIDKIIIGPYDNKQLFISVWYNLH
jgi:hypothetical protein